MIRVLKRDGRFETYDIGKMRKSIENTINACGKSNTFVSYEIARAVTTYLEKNYNNSTVSTNQIRALIVQSLNETANQDVADAYQRYSKKKTSLFDQQEIIIDDVEKEKATTWIKTNIVQMLVKEAGLSFDESSKIADEIEKRISALKQKRVSLTTIRQIATRILSEKGYKIHLGKTIHVNLSEKLLQNSCPIDHEEISSVVAGFVFKHYMLQEYLSRDVAETHLDGRIHIHNLEEPLKLYSFCTANLPETLELTCLLRLIEKLFSEFAQFNISSAKDIQSIYQYFFISNFKKPYPILIADTAFNKLADTLIDFWLENTNTLANMDKVVIVSENFSDNETFSKIVELVSKGHKLRLLFEQSQNSTAQVVSINLPRLCYMSNFNEDRFFEHLDNVIKIASSAHLQKELLIKRVVSSNLAKTLDYLISARRYAVWLYGLYEAIALLQKNNSLTFDEFIRLSLKIASFLYFRTKEESEKNKIEIALEDTDNPLPARRFFQIDKEWFGINQGYYTPGFHLSPADPVEQKIELSTRFSTLIPSTSILIYVDDNQTHLKENISSIIKKFLFAGNKMQLIFCKNE